MCDASRIATWCASRRSDSDQVLGSDCDTTSRPVRTPPMRIGAHGRALAFQRRAPLQCVGRGGTEGDESVRPVHAAEACAMTGVTQASISRYSPSWRRMR